MFRSDIDEELEEEDEQELEELEQLIDDEESIF